MDLIKSINKEAILIGVEPLQLSQFIDQVVLSDIERICTEMRITSEDLDKAFFLNKTGKFADNNSDYVKAYGKINSSYVSSIILAFKKYQIEQNKKVKEYRAEIALPVSKEAENEALIKAFELTKQNVLREYKAGKSIFDISTKWIHTDYYKFFDNKMTDEQKAEYLENVKELVRQNKIKEYQSLHDYPIPKEMKRYIDNSMGKISNYAKCLWMTEQIIKECI